MSPYLMLFISVYVVHRPSTIYLITFTNILRHEKIDLTIADAFLFDDATIVFFLIKT